MAKNEATLATLKIDGFKDRKVTAYNYGFSQAIDKENQPAGIPRGGRLYVKVDAFSQEENVELLNWMVSKTMKKNGEIVVMVPSDPDKTLKKIQFEDAYCVDYKESWADVVRNTDGSMKEPSTNSEEIWITWRKKKVGPVEYENEWV